MLVLRKTYILLAIILLEIFAFKIIVLTNDCVATLETCAGRIKGSLISSTVAKIFGFKDAVRYLR